MKITLTSVPVQDQERALKFYTDRLGFEKREDIPMGEYRWLTVISPEGAKGVELLLEPLGFEPAKDFQSALFEAGIPAASFETDDLEAEVSRLRENGVKLRGEPQEMDGVKMVTFEDTCGNLLCLVEKTA